MLLLYHLCYLVMICLELVVGLIKAWLGTAPGFFLRFSLCTGLSRT